MTKHQDDGAACGAQPIPMRESRPGMVRSRARLAGVLFGLAALMAATPSSARCPDLALVLALDASGSVEEPEFQLQLQGYAAAFRSAAVQDAIRSAGSVDVALVIWADGEMESQLVPFQDVSTPGAADRVAAVIGRLDRAVTGNTGIGRGLWAALDLIEWQRPCATRKVVNVSGDGKESHSPRAQKSIRLPVARARAEEMGVTVNALAIETDELDLAHWYERHVMTGPGSFVMSISNLASFARGIEEKLAREISLPLLAEGEGEASGRMGGRLHYAVAHPDRASP